MSGFVGFSGGGSPEEKKRILGRMLNRIAHRGPDGEGRYADAAAALGARLLSLGEAPPAQAAGPAQSENGAVAVFDGEIYNAGALCKELPPQGSNAAENGAGLILRAYAAWGEGFAQKLRGMFSFMLWDAAAGLFLGARDPFGIKPFYYAALPGGGLIFGSEIKSFLEHPQFEKALNKDALRPYLSFQYPAGDTTFFKGVYSLPPGHYCVWKAGAARRVCYYDVKFAPDEGLGFNESVRLIDAAMHRSVEARRLGGAPAGAFLSGGVDSSYVAACLRPQKSFSVGFERAGGEEPWGNFDETGEAAELSRQLGIENYVRRVGAGECFAAFEDIQYHMDQPQSNPSSVPLWFLAQMARTHVKAALSGEGADEFFGGYALYADTPAMRRFKRLPLCLRRLLGRAAKALPAFKGRNFLLKCAERPEDWFIGQADVFPQRQALALLKPAYRGGPSPRQLTAPWYAKVQNAPELIKKQYLDMHLWVPGDILLKADRMCMAHSLEVRMPLLDLEVLEVARRLPPRHNILGEENKRAFRAAANKTLPNAWAARPKRGFPVPIRHWLREEKYSAIVGGYFNSDFAAEFFDTAALEKLLKDHREGKAQNARKIWTVFSFLVWYKRFFITETGGGPQRETNGKNTE